MQSFHARFTRTALTLLAALATGCGTGSTNDLDASHNGDAAADSAPSDAPRTDAAHADAAHTDTRTQDSGNHADAGNHPDATSGSTDAGSTDVDAGSTDVDAGSTDVDAGSTDVDAGSTDVDAGSTDVDVFMPPVDAGPSSSRLTRHPLGESSAPQGYYAYLPPTYDPAGPPSPLLIALHGIGENGDGTTQLDNVLNPGIGRLIHYDQWPNDRPFVVLIPQHPQDGGCPWGNEIQGFLTWAEANYHVDPHRLYITGLSCGGIGLWNYLGQFPNTEIAAAVPIAGDGHGAWGAQMCNLGRTPIWAFHGDADGTVNVSGTIDPMTQLMACTDPAPVDARMTIYPGVGHDSWDMTYDLSAGHDIYSWLLTHTH